MFWVIINFRIFWVNFPFTEYVVLSVIYLKSIKKSGLQAAVVFQSPGWFPSCTVVDTCFGLELHDPESQVNRHCTFSGHFVEQSHRFVVGLSNTSFLGELNFGCYCSDHIPFCHIILSSFLYIALFCQNHVCLNRDVSILRALDAAYSAG